MIITSSTASCSKKSICIYGQNLHLNHFKPYSDPANAPRQSHPEAVDSMIEIVTNLSLY